MTEKKCSVCGDTDGLPCSLPGCNFTPAQPRPSAAQSAPDEREAYEQACHWRAEGNGRVFESHYFKRSSSDGRYLNPSAEHGWQVWQQARASWQRAQSAPVVPEEAMKLLEIARPYMKGPFGSVCGVWQERYARLLAAAPQPAARQEQGDEVRRLREALEVIAGEDYEAPHDADDAYILRQKSACITRMRHAARAALSASAEGKV